MRGQELRRAGLIVSLVACSGRVLAIEPSTPFALDNLVVTGTRQESQLLDLAGNTSVIKGETIEFTGPKRPSEILDQLPGVNIQQGGGEEHLTAIRSPVLSGGAGQGSFLLMEDGVPLRAAGFGNVNGLYEENIEQAGSVEVVRGPGSALYGSNAVHGLINVIPRAPSRDLEQEIDATAGMFGFARGMATLSDTIGHNGYRLSVEGHHEDGWRDDTRLDEQKVIAREIWTGAEDSLTSTLSGQNLNQQTGVYIVGKDAYLNRALGRTNSSPAPFRLADSVRGMTRWQHDLDNSLQFSMTPYVRFSEMDFVMSYLPSNATQKNAHYSFGAQSAFYKTLDGNHLIILGVDIEYTDGWYNEYQNKPTFKQGANIYPFGLHYDLGVSSTVLAPYAHTEWQVLEHTRLTAGVRAEDTNYDYTNNASNGVLGLYQRIPDRSDSFATVTPKLGAVQQWQNNLASYLNFARGARAPQVTDLYELQAKQVPGQTKIETINSAEIGTRGKLADLAFDGSAFWMNKDHYFYRATDGTNVPNGKTQHRGAELSLSMPLPRAFDIGMSGSYALHTWAFSRTDSPAINSVRKGSIMQEAPRTLANFHLGYSFAPGARGEIEWVHMGAYYTDNADTTRYGGHELLNLRITDKVNDSLSLYVRIFNITDRLYADRAATTTTGSDQYFPGAPRTVMVGANLRF